MSAAVRAFIEAGLRKKSEHPAAAYVDTLSGDIFGFFRSEKRYRRCDVVYSGRAADGKTRVLDAARFVETQFFFVDTRRIYYIHSDSVFCLFERQRARERNDRGLGRSVGGNFRLAERTLGADGSKINDAAPTAFAHVRQRGAAHKHNAHQVGRENILPIFERAFGQCAPAKIAYVVDKNIESPKTIGYGIDELFRAFCG